MPTMVQWLQMQGQKTIDWLIKIQEIESNKINKGLKYKHIQH